MIRDFVHLIQNKLRHYAVFPSLHSLSRSSAFQTALFLLGVLAFARACIFLAPPSVTTLASASVNGTFMPICRVETDQKKVALTFNCTYSAQDMQQLLEILKEKNVHATFFVSDAWAKNYPELLCTIHNAGHDIGGLWTTQASLSIREQTLTLENLTQRIDRLTDSETTLFRFEDGNYDNSAIRLIQEAGGYPVQWNINSMDWKDYGAQDILHRILNSRQLQKRLYPPVPCRNCLYRTGASRPDRQSGGSGLSASSHLRADLEALLLYGCRRRADSEDGTVKWNPAIQRPGRTHPLHSSRSLYTQALLHGFIAERAFYCFFSSFFTSSIDVQYGQRVASAATLLLQ